MNRIWEVMFVICMFAAGFCLGPWPDYSLFFALLATLAFILADEKADRG
jgi:hypothetical protein